MVVSFTEFIQSRLERLTEKLEELRVNIKEKRERVSEYSENSMRERLNEGIEDALRIRWRILMFVAVVYGFAALFFLFFLWSDVVVLNVVLVAFTVPVFVMMFHYRWLLKRRMME